MNWNKNTLGEIYELEGGSIQTGPFGSQLHESDYTEFGVPVIMPKDIVDDKLDSSSIAHISIDDAKRLSQHIVRKNDIICPRRGEIGKRIIIDDQNAGAFCGTGCIRLRGTGSILDPFFLFSFLKQPRVVKWIENQAIGATMMNLNTSIIKSIPIKYPSLTIQHKIASILTNYDELIENNNQRIKLLEQIVEEIYKEWFVRMRFPGYDSTKFFNEEGEDVLYDQVGALPEGWQIGKLKDIVNNVTNGVVANEKLWNSDNRYIPIDIIPRKSMFLDESDKIENAQSSLIKFRKYDILFGAMRAYFHKVIVAPFDGVTRKTCFVLRPKSKDLFSFAYLTIYQDSVVGYAAANSKGSTIPYAFWEGGLDKCTIVIPTSDLVQSFNVIVKPQLDFIVEMQEKNQQLRQTRDLLLPRLISGKLSVEHLIEEVVHLPMAAEPEVAFNTKRSS